MVLKIGITGGIGSGKTTVCRIFRELGIPVYDADSSAKRLMVENTELRAELLQLFGKEIFGNNGSLNRQWLSQLVFNNKELLKKLNALVHPAVHKDYEAWHLQQTGVPYTLKEAALIFETEGQKYLDKVIMVYSPEELRVKRVTQRDNVSPQEVYIRIKEQMPDYDKMLQADFIIFNDEQHPLIKQTHQIHQKLIHLSRIAR